MPFVLQDTNTGRTQPLEGLNRAWEQKQQALNGEQSFILLRPDWAELSPDGKWLALGIERTKYTRHGSDQSSTLETAVVSLDGSQWIEAPEPDGALWTPDSRKCIFLHQDGTVMVWDVFTRKQQKIDLRNYLVKSASWGGYGVIFLGCRTDGRIVVATSSFEDGVRTVKLVDFGVKSGDTSPHSVSISLPPELWSVGSTVHGMALSPTGDRLAWFFEPSGNWQTQLWISHADGTQMRLVGRQQAHVDPARSGDMSQYSIMSLSYLLPLTLQWTPDGKRISFLYKGVLYTVPAD